MKEKLFEILRNTLDVEVVDESTSQDNCPQWDSMNHLNLVLNIEMEFNISLTPEEIGSVLSAKDFIDLINIKIQ